MHTLKHFTFAEDHVKLADLEDALQTSIHKLETVIFKYGLKI